MASLVDALIATLSWLPNLVLLLVGIQITVGQHCYWAVLGIYNVFFHPLAQFPGPKLWAAYRLPFIISMVRGNLAHQTKAFHAKYGNIVRTAPDEISFTDEHAWRDIYAHRAGHQDFPQVKKWNTIPSLGKIKKPDHILNANNADHSRIRKLFSHAFSEKALAKQEPLIQSYIDLLINQLRKQVEMSKGFALNISTWYNFLTFDIVGDLGFGEPFNCLKDVKYHAWVGVAVGQFKVATFEIAMQYYSAGRWLLQNCMPQKVYSNIVKHNQFSDGMVRRRLNLKVERPDFLSEVQKHNDEKGMTVEEVVETSKIMIVAGSESTSFTLSGISSHLARNPDVMEEIVREIRGTFKNESLITSGAVYKLPFLNAVIQEGLRLFPAVPDGFRREIPAGGDTVCVEWLPEGTVVKFSLWAAFMSSSNFARPTEFLPERWLAKNSSSPSEFDNDNRKIFNPFGLGTRNCIGQNLAWMELRLVLARMIWNFDISLPTGSPELELESWKTYRVWEKEPIEVVLTPT